jgi:hypothetical protein
MLCLFAYVMLHLSYVRLYASIYVIYLYALMFMVQCFTHAYVMIRLCDAEGSNPNT